MKYDKIVSAKKFLKTAAILTAAQAAIPGAVFADDGELNVTPPNVSIVEVLTRVRNYFLGAVIVTCVFMILWGAFNYTTSAGDEKKVETAKKTIYYAVIGLIIALLAVGIVSLVRGIVEG
jgi:hypothetical protein